jgi:hypothetical protein
MRKAVYIGLGMLFLLTVSLPSAFAQTYAIVAVGAIHYADDTLYVTPVYGKDVLNDSLNGILRFTVLNHPLGWQQYLGASKNVSDVSKPINALPILKTLNEGEIIEINYKDCEYTNFTITQDPLQNYWIAYIGQANSATINTVEIPEFSSIIATTTFFAVTIAIVFISLKLPPKKINNTSP